MISSSSKPTKSTFIEVNSPHDKDQRKEVHQIIRALSSKFDSETLDQSGKKTIKISVVDSKQKRRRYEEREYPDKFLQFTLTKTNYDSLGAVGFLARFMNRKPSNFGVAGTKVL